MTFASFADDPARRAAQQALATDPAHGPTPVTPAVRFHVQGDGAAALEIQHALRAAAEVPAAQSAVDLNVQGDRIRLAGSAEQRLRWHRGGAAVVEVDDRLDPTSQAFIAAVGRSPLVVRAGTSFVEAVRYAWLLEAMALLGEGCDAESIEDRSRALGFADGPFAQLDRLSLVRADQMLHAAMEHGQGAGHAHDHDHDHAHEHRHGHQQAHDHHDHDHHDHAHHDHAHGHCHHHAAEHGHHHGDAHPAHTEQAPPPIEVPESAVYVIEKMAHGFGRIGGPGAAGFLQPTDDPDDPEPPLPWSGLSVFARGRKAPPFADLEARLLLAPALVALRLAFDGTLATTDARRARASADAASVIGAGFPTTHGGCLAWLAAQDPTVLKADCLRLSTQYGARFELPDAYARLHAETAR